MAQILVLFGSSCLAIKSAISGGYMQYLARFGKSYSSIEEFREREAYYYKLDAWIEEFNSDPEATSTVGHNLFSDWSPEERKTLYSQE